MDNFNNLYDVPTDELINFQVDDMNLFSMPSHAPFLPMIPDVPKPNVVITEQPKSRGFRFRYQCEGRSAGSILGESSTAENKTYPTIQVCNYQGPAIVIVSCVTKDDIPKPHPHSLVGKDCKKGVCTLQVSSTDSITFPNLGIQCVKKREVVDALNARKSINVDPYRTGFAHAKDMNIDFSTVRLCFQVFIADMDGNLKKPLQPVSSQNIIDKKAQTDLSIFRMDKCSGKSTGHDEVFLLCEKVSKDDIKVRFFENDKEGNCIWEDFGSFGHSDVHRQYAIVFQTPAYKDPFITKSVSVSLQLFRPTDQACSEPKEFLYQPQDPDPDRIAIKRKRKASTPKYDGTPSEPTVPDSSEIKKLLRSKTIRKAEAAGCPSINDTSVKSEIQAATSICNYSVESGFPGRAENPHVPMPPPDNSFACDDLAFFNTDPDNLSTIFPQTSELGEMTAESLQQCLANFPSFLLPEN
uniref:REL/NF-kappaB n=1 Tax=Euprymna scolopes TaxID=6613 RepID=Q32S39_EUPSC|nr:REL/NF-kappaB [Euprymna scolopes]